MSLETAIERNIIEIELQIKKGIIGDWFYKAFRALDWGLALSDKQFINDGSILFEVVAVGYLGSFSLGRFSHKVTVYFLLEHVAELDEKLVSIVLLWGCEFVFE